MTVSEETICILAGDPSTASRLAQELGCIDGRLALVSKYYSASVAVCIESMPDRLSDSVKAIIVMHDMADKIGQLTLSDDSVCIVYSEDETLLDRCIDHGFELITPSGDTEECGVARVREALKCRMWSTPSIASPPEQDGEKMLDSLDDLMLRIKNVRDSVTDDASRRKMAETLAFELAALLGSDSDESTS